MSTKVVINESPQYKLSVTDGTDQTLSVTNGIELQVTANVGGQGPAGPNQITTTTSTSLSGFISGNGSTISGATAGSFNTTGSTLVLRDIDGRLQAKQIRLKEAGDTHYTQINPSANTESVSFNFPLESGTIASNKTAVMKTEDQTVAGDKTFTGQMELTGQAATSSTSAMTRALVDARIMPQAHLPSRFVISESDFLTSTTATAPYGIGFSAFSTGTGGASSANQFADANHIGITSFVTYTGTTAGTSGLWIGANLLPLVLSGKEEYTVIFSPVDQDPNVFFRIGFSSDMRSLTPAQAIYAEGKPNGLGGVVFSAVSIKTVGGEKTTTTNPVTYTGQIDVWYRMVIATNSGGTSASYYLYSSTGVLLWTATNNTNIPSGERIGPGLICGNSIGTTSYHLLVDYHKFEINRTLIR